LFAAAVTAAWHLRPSAAMAQITFLNAWGSQGGGNGDFNDPYGIAVSGSGNVYVTDFYNAGVEIFNSSGVFQSSFGSQGVGNGDFVYPTGVAVSGSGNVYVADYGNDRVQVFNSSGVFQSSFGSSGTGNGDFDGPPGVAVSGSGNVYVADLGNNRVEVFNSSGVFQSTFGSFGTGNGEFELPEGIAVSGSGNVYVTDYDNDRVEVFNSSGVFQSSFGSSGTGNGDFEGPVGVAVSGSGNVYVVDYGNERVEVFNSSGVFQSSFGSVGTGNGDFSGPIGVAVSGSGNVYVTDEGSDRIEQFFDPSSWVSGTNTFTNPSIGPTTVTVGGTNPLLGSSFTLNSSMGLTATTISVSAGSLTLSGGAVSAGGLTIDSGGTVTNAGTISLTGSDSTATPTGGTFTQTSSGILNVQINGTGAGQFGQLTVGQAALGGTLSVTVANGYFPPPAATFQILSSNSITGTFNGGLPIVQAAPSTSGPSNDFFRLDYPTTADSVFLTAITPLKYKQKDPDWATLPLVAANPDGFTMGGSGCTITALATIASDYGSLSDPGDLLNILQTANQITTAPGPHQGDANLNSLGIVTPEGELFPSRPLLPGLAGIAQEIESSGPVLLALPSTNPLHDPLQGQGHFHYVVAYAVQGTGPVCPDDIVISDPGHSNFPGNPTDSQSQVITLQDYFNLANDNWTGTYIFGAEQWFQSGQFTNTQNSSLEKLSVPNQKRLVTDYTFTGTATNSIEVDSPVELVLTDQVTGQQYASSSADAPPGATVLTKIDADDTDDLDATTPDSADPFPAYVLDLPNGVDSDDLSVELIGIGSGSYTVTYDSGVPGLTASGPLEGTISDGQVINGEFTIVPEPTAAMWNADGGGTWELGTNWSSLYAPYLAQDAVTFGPSNTTAAVVTLDGSWTVGTVNFASSNSYTLSPGAGGTLTLDNGSTAASINVSSGSHFITAPLSLNSNLLVTVANSGEALTLSGPIGGSASLTVSGSGTLRFSQGVGTPAFTALAVNSGATLDITTTALAINFGSPASDPISTIVSELSAGYHGATAWTGTSVSGGVITSSTAAAGGKAVSVGYLDGNIDTTDSSEVAPNQILVKYTLTGDTNLDGIVNFTDFATVLKNFALPGTDWAEGNFTYNANSPSIQGTNFTDFADVLANFLQPLPGGGGGETIGGTVEPLTTTVQILPTTPALPEPTSLSLLAAGAAGLLRRRRKAKT